MTILYFLFSRDFMDEFMQTSIISTRAYHPFGNILAGIMNAFDVALKWSGNYDFIISMIAAMSALITYVVMTAKNETP